jgi:hypothetical protein
VLTDPLRVRYNDCVKKTTSPSRYSEREAERLLARLVAFAETPLERMRASRQVLLDVLQYGPVIESGDARHEILGTDDTPPWPPSAYAKIQRRLRTFFRNVVSLAKNEGGQIPELKINGLVFGATPVRADGGVMITVSGSAADVLAFQALQLLQTAGLSRLRQCECGRIFAKTGRGSKRLEPTCSERCYRRFYMRRFRIGEFDGEI